MFYGGKLKFMLFKLVSDDGKYVVICFLVYCNEKDIEKYVQVVEFLIIFCNLCGLQENLQCQNIKMMLQDWYCCYFGCIEFMFCVMQNVILLYLVDSNLYDFKFIKVIGVVFEDGDIVFDKLEFF